MLADVNKNIFSEIESNNNGNVAESGHEVRNHLNLRAATIHVLGDVITSFGVLVASVIIYFFPNLKLLDPICELNCLSICSIHFIIGE